jgi:hypothetical protein
MDTLQAIMGTVAEQTTETALKSIPRLVRSDESPIVPFACAIAIAFHQSSATRLSPERKKVFEKLATESNKRAKRLALEDSAESLIARGTAQLLKYMRYQFNGCPHVSHRYARQIEQAKALIEQASVMEPDNSFYELAHAVSLRFFFIEVQYDDGRKQDGFSRLVTLSQQPGSVGRVAKLMVLNHAMRRRQWDLLLETSRDLKRAFRRSSCMRTYAGIAHLYLGHEALARQQLKIALRMNPNDLFTQRQLDRTEEFFRKRRSIQKRTRGRQQYQR